MVAFYLPVRLSASKYRALAVFFDGTTTMTRTSNLSGIADGTDGTISFWFQFTGGDGTTLQLFRIANGGASSLSINRVASNSFSLAANSAAPSTLINLTTVETYVADGAWHNLAASWNSATTKFYIDGVAVGTGVTRNAGSVNLANNPVNVGFFTGTSNRYIGDLAEVWFNPSYIDLSVSANLQLFRTSTGKAPSLGSNGSVPTGSQPMLYLRGPASIFTTNQGTGGDFTISAGALTNAATSPSD